jgi:hypothetical protein
MQGREKAGFRRRVGLLVVAALAVLLAFGVASPAIAKKKKHKKVVPAITTTAVAPLSSAGSASATANCAGKTHISGGGYAVSPHLTFNPGAGLNAVSSTSIPVGATAWNAKADAFVVPPSSGSLTTMARCESNTLSTLATVVSGSASVPQGIQANLQIQCPTGTHVVGAGYDGTGLASYTLNNSSFRIFILQSRRTAINQWTISAFESNVGNPGPGTVNVAAICERDARGRSIGEVAALAPFGNAARASADPTCPAKQHVVSGGFGLSPSPSNGGNPPVVGIDEFEPVGNSTWHVGLHTVPTQPQPPGSSVAGYAYCANDTIKKKKKKKRK